MTDIQDQEPVDALDEIGPETTGEPPTPSTEVKTLAARMREKGWEGPPLVVHGDQVLGGLERYEAARLLGIEHEIPTVTLEELYTEAGVDFAEPETPGAGSQQPGELFEDYLRDLPRHIRDKYQV